MKRLALAVLVVVSLGISSCSSPASQSPASAISKAKTVSELDALVNRFLDEQEFDAALAATEKAIEMDPNNTERYIAAVSVIRKEADVKFEKAHALLETASRIAYDAAGKGESQQLDRLAAWVEDNRPELPWGLPPLPDYTSPGQINSIGNTDSNLMNAGRVAGQGDWVYFCNTSDNNFLYKMRADGSRLQKVVDDRITYLNVAGDWVYYCCENESNSIWKVKTDGTGRARICEDTSCYNLVVAGDWVYYLVNGQGSGVYRIHLDGSGKGSLVSGDVQCFAVVDDWVYYISKKDGGQVRRVRTGGGEDAVCIGQAVVSFDVAGDWVYYCAMDKGVSLYKARLDGTGETLLDSSPKCVNISVAGDWIYYVVRVEGQRNNFAKVRTDGIGREVFSEVSGDDFNIIGDWMYYMNRDDGGLLYRMHLDGSENRRVPK